MSKVVTRFSPSPSIDSKGNPTGPHCGNGRTMLGSWLYAKKHGGSFILRIENTSKENSSKESIQPILDTLEWLNIKSDAEIWYQADRMHIYNEYVDKLIESGKAYFCFCPPDELEKKREEQKAKGAKPKYDKKCTHLSPEEVKRLLDSGAPHVVRFNVPEWGGVQYRDLVRARVNIRNIEQTDFILRRSNGDVTFVLANFLDDALAGVTHVIRGEDSLSYTNLQVMLCEALGFPVPQYASLPFVLNMDGSKLSKSAGDAPILDLKDKGFLPEAVLNALALLGLGFGGGGREVFTVEELIESFDINKVSKCASKFDFNKLVFLNQQHMKKADSERLATLLCPFLAKRDINLEEFFHGPNIADAVKTLQTRAKTLEDMADQITFYYKSDFPLDPLTGEAEGLLYMLIVLLNEQPPADAVKNTCEKMGCSIKDLGPVVRKALTGSLTAPGVIEIMEVLGKEETVKRLERAISI